ncbi:MAG: Clp protease ClpP [Clostridiales bacterium]|nr:Clp protease ClpP [Clostridiales bacterium]
MSMYDIRNESPDAIDVYIYSDVENAWWGGEDSMGADKFRQELEKNKNASQINLYINSMGGSVSEGVAIYNQIKRHKAHVTAYIDGFACSIASVIPMAADEIIMGKNAMFMIHNPWTIEMGNAKKLRKAAEDLDKIRDGCIIPAYKERCGDKISDEKLLELLDSESLITSDEALEYGFCDKILTVSDEEKKAEASDKIKQCYDSAKAEIRNDMFSRFGEMVAKAKAKEDLPLAAEIAENAAEKQQEETHENVSDVTDTNDGNIETNDANTGINDVNAKTESEPEKAENTPEPVEDKVKTNDYFMKLLKGEM